jgi:hypothetical protein
MENLIKNPTQCERILKVLQDANGGWVNGRYFVQTMLLSQYHARIWELQRKGYDIEASERTDQYGFKLYRLRPGLSKSLFSKVKTKDEQDRFMVMGY